MKEIGGYIELDTYHLPMLHETAIPLNCGRNALAYLIRARGIKRILLPRFLCASVTDVCKRERVEICYYRITEDFLPADAVTLEDDAWLYLVNFYGQLHNAVISSYVRRYRRVIVDQAQGYYQMPLPGVDTLYTCRKYFGVADGAFLYTDARLEEDLPQDESFDRMRFLLGRFERTASEFYGEYTVNNHFFADAPMKRMSKLTDNLLHGIDYELVKRKRTENFTTLHTYLGAMNRLKLSIPEGAFMYPLWMEHGAEVRKHLQARKIFIPTLWPDVFSLCGKEELEYRLAQDILPLPVDQRYGPEEMRYMVSALLECLER